MIKKMFMIVLALTLVNASAFAAGRLTIMQERIITYDNYGTIEARIFAEVENTGDKPVEYSAGTVELFDADGNTLQATDYVTCYPWVIAPGEKGYVFVTMHPENATVSDIADYSLNVIGITSSNDAGLLPSTDTFELMQEGNWTYYIMKAEVTNVTSDIVYNPYCVFALKDASGQLLYVDYIGYLWPVGFSAGSTFFLRYSMPDIFMTYFKDHDLVPSTVDAIVFQY